MPTQTTRTLNRIALPLIFGLVGAGVLIALGLWQVQRLEWKQDILAEIEARIHADPVEVPMLPDPAADRYLPVKATGTILAEPEAHVLVSVKRVGPGYRIIAPFEIDGGRRVLLDRGFVRLAGRDAGRSDVTATVIGNLHWPDDRTSSTPENDEAGNTWFARDIPALAAALGTEPVLIVARATSETDPAVMPLPVDGAQIPNDHLEYAVTWFGLAIVWLGMTGYFVYRSARTIRS